MEVRFEQATITSEHDRRRGGSGGSFRLRDGGRTRDLRERQLRDRDLRRAELRGLGLRACRHRVTRTSTGWTSPRATSTGSGRYWQAAQGTKSIDLDGAENTAGAISQTFDTVVNGTYVVTFSMSGNPGAGAADQDHDGRRRRHDAGLHLQHRHEWHRPSPHMNWAAKTFTFVGEEHPDHADLHQHDRQRLGPCASTTSSSPRPSRPAPTARTAAGRRWSTRPATSFRNQGDCVSYYATGEKNLASGVN